MMWSRSPLMTTGTTHDPMMTTHPLINTGTRHDQFVVHKLDNQYIISRNGTITIRTLQCPTKNSHVPFWRTLHTLDTCTPVEGPAYPGHMYPCGGPCIPWTHVPLWRALHTLDTCTPVEGPAYPGHMYPCGGPCIPWTHRQM